MKYLILVMMILALGVTTFAQNRQSLQESVHKVMLQPVHLQPSVIQPTQNKKLFVASTAVYWGGVAADVVSSQNKLETNSLVRNNDGSINTGKFIVVNGGVYAVTLIFDKTHHSKIANTLRFALGGMHVAYAVHNTTVPRFR